MGASFILHFYYYTTITELETIFGGGGDINAMLRLTLTELLRVTEAEVVALLE